MLFRSSKVVKRVPRLQGGDFEGGIWSPDDGFVDATRLLAGYIQLATGCGAHARFETGVCGVRVERGRVVGVETPFEFIPARIVVNAAGAWAQEIGGLVTTRSLAFRPCRRHLFLSEKARWIDPAWPFVWDVSHQIYFRPDSGRLLLSPCDEDLAPAGIPETETRVAELLSQKIERHLPSLMGLPIWRSWAGLRTLTSDGRFVIGWDPKVEGLFWVAGLGGHGVTTSHSVGALAADMIVGVERSEARAFSPSRFFDDD